MKNGLAAWHYPHRTMIENIQYFSAEGFEYLSLLGSRFAETVENEEKGAKLADVIEKSGAVITVHYILPVSHSEADVKVFEKGIEAIGSWQKKYNLISVLSFDVPQKIRDNITDYIDFVMAAVKNARIAVEDFGLTENERLQIEHLKTNERFGYLIDIGHMYIRLRGENTNEVTLFTNSPDEGGVCPVPSFNEFLQAFKSKQFPVFEIHLHNNDGVNDLHYFLEDGTLDIKMIAKVLKELGYDGILTIESAPGFKFECKGAEADAKILNTYNYWKKCCENV